MKYKETVTAVFSLFGSPSWKSEAVTTIPSNFSNKTSLPYVVVDVIPSGNPLNITSTRGMLLCVIHTAAGRGPDEYLSIADKLNSYLEGKTIDSQNGVVQFGKSSLSPLPSKEGAEAFRATLSIPFNFFGV